MTVGEDKAKGVTCEACVQHGIVRLGAWSQGLGVTGKGDYTHVDVGKS